MSSSRATAQIYLHGNIVLQSLFVTCEFNLNELCTSILIIVMILCFSVIVLFFIFFVIIDISSVAIIISTIINIYFQFEVVKTIF